jgi:pimeloyl-ACP methyl ester carboxylesterase
VAGFIDALGLESYVMYKQDFGSCVGYRVARRYPERLAWARGGRATGLKSWG